MKVTEIESGRGWSNKGSKMLWMAAAKVFQLPEWETMQEVFRGNKPISSLYENQGFGAYEPEICQNYNVDGILLSITILTAASRRRVEYSVAEGLETDIVRIYFGDDGSTAAAGAILYWFKQSIVAKETETTYINAVLNNLGNFITTEKGDVIRFSDYTGPIDPNDYALHRAKSN